MGGPAVSIVLSYEPNDVHREALWRDLEMLGPRAPAGREWPDIWFETTHPIGGSYSGEGCPFGITWTTGEACSKEREEFPSWRHALADGLGLIPQSEIRFSAGCNARDDHRVMGELAVHFATKLRGVIDFGGVLTAASMSLGRGPAELLWLFQEASWPDIMEPCARFFRTLPGRIIAVPYRTRNGRTWATHVCDPEFMTAWLGHSDFHMIK